jgi:hypothetical protein
MMLVAADQAQTIDPLLTLLVGALGAAALGLIGAWIQARREHSKWRREQRLAAYLVALADIERNIAFTMRNGKKAEVTDDEAAASRLAGATVSLVGPVKVVSALNHYSVAFRKWDGEDVTRREHLDEVRLKLLSTMRSVLRTESRLLRAFWTRRNIIRTWWLKRRRTRRDAKAETEAGS